MVLLDIGNTHTRLAEYHDGKIVLRKIVETAALSADHLQGLNAPFFGISVVPQAAARLPQVRFVHAAECGGLLDFSAVDSSTLGADRIANAVAAAELSAPPVLVVDCGTAVTLEFVNEARMFMGGAIAPGRVLMRKALNLNTAQLPKIPLSQRLPRVPGVCTAEAIRFGIDGGAIGMVRELIEATRRCYGDFEVVITGGDAPFFASALGLPQAPEDFTLRGLLKIAQNCGAK